LVINTDIKEILVVESYINPDLRGRVSQWAPSLLCTEF